MYLGPLRAVRPRRVAVAAVAEQPVVPAEVMRSLKKLGARTLFAAT
jgi:hypothetical protein